MSPVRSRWVVLAGAVGATIGIVTGPGPADAAGTATRAAAAADTSSAAHHHRPRNLLHGNAATFNTGAGGWSSPAAGVSDNHGHVHRGGGALAVRPRLSPGRSSVRVVSRAVGGRSGIYSATVWVSGSSARSGVTPTLLFLDSSRQVITTVNGASAKPRNGWVQAPTVSALAPSGTTYVRAGILINNPRFGSVVYVDDARLVRTPKAKLPALHRLSVRRNHIVDGHGHRVLLKGINRPGLSVKSNWSMTARDVAAMAEWGVNNVRLPISPNFWLPSGCAYDPQYRTRVDDIVRMLSRAHIMTMLDLQTVTPCDGTSNYPMPSRALAVPFWHQVATRYKDSPLVSFDLFNEPHDITTHTWLRGGTIQWAGTTYQAVGMQTMYDVVRATGARNIVFVSGMRWSAAPSRKTIRGSNIVYAAHAYTCPHSPPPNCSFKGNPYDASYYLDRWTSLARHHPVVVTEFGWPNRNDPGRYIQNMVVGAERRGFGWSVYGYNSTTTGKFDIVGQRLAHHVYEPTPVAMAALRQLARR